jgi:integrase
MPRQEALDGDIQRMPGREKAGRDYYRLRYRDAAGDVRYAGLGRGTNKELNERARGIRDGVATNKPPAPRGGKRTVAQAWSDYQRDWMQDLRKSTQQGYASIWRQHLEPHLANLTVREVSRDRLREVLEETTKGGLSTKTRNHVLEVMKAFFGFCVDKGLAGTNPATGIKKKKASEPAKIAATGPDISALKRELDGQDLLLVWLLEVSGLRFGEALGLQWTDLMGKGWRRRAVQVRQDFVRGEVGYTKTDPSKRTVPITPRLADALATMFNQRNAQPEDFVFTKTDGKKPMGGDDWRKRVFKPASKRAGVRFQIKDLRDHAITRWVESGDMNLLEVQEVAGHTQAQTTMGYFRRSGTSLKKARDAAERAAL